MLVKSLGALRRAVVHRALPMVQHTRNSAQMTLCVCTPPRVRVSFGEKLVHMAVMIFCWTTPIAYFMSQIKVWRKEYIGDRV